MLIVRGVRNDVVGKMIILGYLTHHEATATLDQQEVYLSGKLT